MPSATSSSSRSPSVGADGRRRATRFSEVESTKSVSDIYAPVAGHDRRPSTTTLADAPEQVNEDPYGDGWLCVIELADPAEVDGLLDAAAYRALVEG